MLVVSGELVEIKSVYPSGAALATASAPMLPPAPGRFSMTTGCFHAAVNRSPSARARMSTVPPAVYGAVVRVAPSGYWAEGSQVTVSAANAPRNDPPTPAWHLCQYPP